MANVSYIRCDWCGKSVPISESQGWLVRAGVYKMRLGNKNNSKPLLSHNDYCEAACLVADLNTRLKGKDGK